jgi:hypothetical protein
MLFALTLCGTGRWAIYAHERPPQHGAIRHPVIECIIAVTRRTKDVLCVPGG